MNRATTQVCRIVLTGFMCAGKTTVARALAARLRCPMIDTDALILERTGRTVEAIIDEDGEPRFRQIETETLRALLADDAGTHVVVALGGGAWTIAENRALIDAHGCHTVWLDAPFELCWRRITESVEARPLARERAAAHALYDARRAVYELASLRVEIDGAQSAEDTAAEIESIIGRQNFRTNTSEREEENTDG